MEYCAGLKVLCILFAFTIWLTVVATMLICLITIAVNTKRIANSQIQIAQAVQELAARKVQ